jgi:hypothetical protein
MISNKRHDEQIVRARFLAVLGTLAQTSDLDDPIAKDIIRATVNGTLWGYIFDGHISAAAAVALDADPQAINTMQRDHATTWKVLAAELLAAAQRGAPADELWATLKRGCVVVVVTRQEHALLSGLQRKDPATAYARAGIKVLRARKSSQFKSRGYRVALNGAWERAQ